MTLWINSSLDEIKLVMDLGKGNGRETFTVSPSQTISFDDKFDKAVKMEADQLIPFKDCISIYTTEAVAEVKVKPRKGQDKYDYLLKDILNEIKAKDGIH